MALTTCPECAQNVSDKAPSCIHCGCPLQESVGSGTALVTTQHTSKHIKLMLLSFVALTLGSCSGLLYEASHTPDAKPGPMAMLWSLLFLVGIGGYLVTKLRAWWHHG